MPYLVSSLMSLDQPLEQLFQYYLGFWCQLLEHILEPKTCFQPILSHLWWEHVLHMIHGKYMDHNGSPLAMIFSEWSKRPERDLCNSLWTFHLALWSLAMSIAKFWHRADAPWIHNFVQPGTTLQAWSTVGLPFRNKRRGKGKNVFFRACPCIFVWVLSIGLSMDLSSRITTLPGPVSEASEACVFDSAVW